MEKNSAHHSTIIIETRYPATAERVFRAMADPLQKRRWMRGEGGECGEGFEMDFRVGGRERSWSTMGENTPFPGALLVNDTVFLDIIENRRIVLAYSMTLGEKRISASLATFDLIPTDGGTELVFTDQGAYFEGADGPEGREHGWRFLLGRLGEALSR